MQDSVATQAASEVEAVTRSKPTYVGGHWARNPERWRPDLKGYHPRHLRPETDVWGVAE